MTVERTPSCISYVIEGENYTLFLGISIEGDYIFELKKDSTSIHYFLKSSLKDC